MSKKRFVLASVVMVALSASVYAAPINIVDNNGNIGKEGQTFTAGTGGNITLGNGAGATNGKGKGINAQGNNIALGTVAGAGSTGGGNINIGAKSFRDSTGDFNITVGFAAGNTSQLTNFIVMGTQSGEKSVGDKNVWIGNFQGANSKASNSVAIGSNSTVNGQFDLAVGHYVNVKAAKGLAVGSYNTLSEKATASGVFGQGEYGKTAIDAVNSYSVGNYNHISGENTFVLGNNVTTSLKNGVILGNDFTDGDVVGTASHTFENGTTVNYAGTAPVSTVSVGAKDKERTITNLAAGRVSATSTDAINGSQLHGVHQMIDALGKSTSQQLNTSISTIEKSIQQVNTKVQNVENSVQHVSQEVQRVESESNKGDASAAALAALHPLPYDPDNRVQYMAGYGHYKNANAVALGIGYYHKDNLLLTTGFTMNNHVMANVGITYKPGKSLPTTMSPASYNALEQRVQALETQNKDLQETVKRLVDKLEK